MKCQVCGQDYGVAHQCAGIAAAPDISDVPPPPKGFALGHYLGEALRIATWNDDAVRRTMNDPNAILYGVIIYMIAISLQLAVPVSLLLLAGRVEHAVIVASSVAILLLASVGLDLSKIVICHFFSKWFADGSGTFTQLLGPLLLGSIVHALALSPVLGTLAAGIAWLAVFAIVFQEVHGIEPLKAILICGFVNFAFFVIQIYALPAQPR